MNRRVAGAVVAAVGSLTLTAGAYLPWFAGTTARETSIARLVQADISGVASSYWTSLAGPLAVAGAVGVIGAAMRSRILLGLTWLVGVVTLALWYVMQALDNAPDRGLGAGDLESGFWVCAFGLLVLTVGILTMGARHDEVEIPLSVFDGDPPQ